MAIIFKDNKFHLCNEFLSYVIQIGKDNDLLNAYFGSPVEIEDVNAEYTSPKNWQPYKPVDGEKYNLGRLPLEYPTAVTPDYRSPAFEANMATGVNSFRFKYKDYKIVSGNRL